MASEANALQDEIARRTTQGWQVVSRGANDAQMRRPKRFSPVWAFLWLLVFGVGILVYLFWHWAKRDELIFLRVVDGQLVVTGERRGVLGVLLAPFRVLFAPIRAWWRWARGRQTVWTKTLAYGSPIIGFLVLIIVISIIGAATDAGGRDGDAESAAALPTESAEAPAGTGDQEAAQPTATPEPTEEKIESKVTAAAGAVAQARDVRVTLNEIVDPWVDSSGFMPQQPDPGKRFVAFDVTIERVKGRQHYASQFKFKVTDIEDFAYEPAIFWLQPSRLTGVYLGSGEKVRGWIGFEVNEGTPLKVLKYDPDILADDIEFQFQ